MSKHDVLCAVLSSFTVIATASASPVDASWESLDRYECPEWFRDAKLGIFVCWNLHSLQGVDDWYAFNTYLPGHRTYEHHVKTYGHPSEFGFKDFVAL